MEAGASRGTRAQPHLGGQPQLGARHAGTAGLLRRHRGNRRTRGCQGQRMVATGASRGPPTPAPREMLRRGSKACKGRRHLSHRLSWQQEQALSSSIYLVRETGPTGFLLREEEPENRDFRVTTAPCSPALRPAEAAGAQAHPVSSPAAPAAARCRAPRACPPCRTCTSQGHIAFVREVRQWRLGLQFASSSRKVMAL